MERSIYEEDEDHLHFGPATDEEPVLMTMIQSGMDIARLNFSHGTKEDHHRRIAMVRRAGEKLGVPVGVLLDTKGPENPHRKDGERLRHPAGRHGGPRHDG